MTANLFWNRLPGALRVAVPLAALVLLPQIAAAATCNGATATIVGTAGDDIINGTDKRDVIAALGGNDVINGRKGEDLICGDDGNDTVNAGDGEDIVYGGRGNDTLNGDRGEDQLFGDLGTDTLNGGIGEDNCDGGIGEDTAANCTVSDNVDMLVKKVAVPVPGGFVPRTIPPIVAVTINALDGALFVPKNSRKVAVLATHSAQGRFETGVAGWIGWWLEPYHLTTLSLNRRDSVAYGANEGGGATIYEDTLCDAGRGVDYLISLGYEQVIVLGHSKGTTVAAVYPSYYKNCPGKSGMIPPNDPNVAGVITVGTVANDREAGLYAPFGAICYDANIAVALSLQGSGFGDTLFFNTNPFSPPFLWNSPFCIQPPGVPFPLRAFTTTPNSYLSYSGPTTRRNVDVQALNLTSPYLVIHAEGDRTTLRAWSDRLVNSVLLPAGKDVTYETPPYESLGYPNPAPGFDAHSLTAEPSRFDATARINTWATTKIPAVNEVSGAVDFGTIAVLPNFSPALQPSPTNP